MICLAHISYSIFSPNQQLVFVHKNSLMPSRFLLQGRWRVISNRWLLSPICRIGICSLHMRDCHTFNTALSSASARRTRTKGEHDRSTEDSRRIGMYIWHLCNISFDRIHWRDTWTTFATVRLECSASGNCVHYKWRSVCGMWSSYRNI